MLLSVSALTGGGGGGRHKPSRPDEAADNSSGPCCPCSCSPENRACDVNSNCERPGGRGKEEEGEEMDLADRPEPEGLNETDGPTGE